jgi:quinol monooxygenase YgiN
MTASLIAAAFLAIGSATNEVETASATNSLSMIVRIAEIEVLPEHLEAYLAAAKTVGAESVAKEPGVVCIFPMQKKEHPTQIRIVEIYRDEAAYKAHLETPHFKAYKTGTLHMVKSLHLAPMQPLDPEHMNLIFKKEDAK